MLLGSVGRLTAAFARIPLTLLREGGIVAAFLTTLALVLACVTWDTIAQRRLHPAFAWGARLLVVSWPLRLARSQTPQWLEFARWLAGNVSIQIDVPRSAENTSELQTYAQLLCRLQLETHHTTMYTPI